MLSLNSKQCTICKEDKPIVGNFNKKKSSTDGYQNVCKSCTAITSKKHYEANKEKIKKRTRDREKRITPLIYELILSALKGGCVDCGESDILVLDFDHIDPSNKITEISRLVTDKAPLYKIEEELTKCEVRCANCHRRKTAAQLNSWKFKIIGSVV